jgi:hypothetical protein
MKPFLILFILLTCLYVPSQAQYSLQWQKTWNFHSIPVKAITTSDGGIVVIGYTTGRPDPKPVQPALAAKGAAQPKGGKAGAQASAQQKLQDTQDTPGDSGVEVPEIPQEVSEPPVPTTADGKSDSKSYAWIMKMEADSHKVWEKKLGSGKGNDRFTSLLETSDKNLLLAGYTDSKGAGKTDGWLLKMDLNGNILEDTTFGGKKDDKFNAVIETQDKGIAIAGVTESKGKGEGDYWLIRLDNKGKKIYDVTDGGGKMDVANSLVEAHDNGIVLIGYSIAPFGYGGRDIFLTKFDKDGLKKWDKIRGGPKNEDVISASITSDGLITIFGTNESKNESYLCGWILKVSQDGKKWPLDKVFPSHGMIRYTPVKGNALIETSDKNLVVTGNCFSFKKEDDILLIKFNADGDVDSYNVEGGKSEDEGMTLVETRDKGILVLGVTEGDKLVLMKFK